MSRIPVASSMPAAFYDRYLVRPDREFYFTKRNGSWQPKTYSQGFDFIRSTMAGLRKLQFERGQVAIIFSENREEWTLTDYAIQWMGGATSAIYTTSSVDQIQYILNESEAVGLFCSNGHLLERISQISEFKFLKWIVAWDPIPLEKRPSKLAFYSKDEFLKESLSETESKNMLAKIVPSDLAILLYTSGTTGEPKGVMLTHLNVMFDIKSMLKAFPLVDEDKIALSFLPLSHVYERLVHSGFLFAGVQTYFSESLEKLIDNLAEARPHIMSAVPRIFEKMYARIQEKLKSASFFRRMIFRWAFSVAEKMQQCQDAGRSSSMMGRFFFCTADFLVLRKIRAITGGRAQLFISGGAPLSPEISRFFFLAGLKIMEGYGLSETCILSVNRPEKFRVGTGGILFDGVEMKFSEDGEILVRGPMVMQGYYKRADENSQVITADGWFHTGDIGEFDQDGFLKITDRKKDLIILSAGKKIAPQPIENALKSHALVESVCLVGDQRSYMVALVVPNYEMCKSWSKRKGLQCKNLNDCISLKEIQDYFQRVIDEINETLPRYSTIKYFKLLNAHFSVETGELTPTLKIKRRVIQQKYKKEIDELYESHDSKESA